LAILKYYKVDGDGKIERLRRECPTETCGAGIFMVSRLVDISETAQSNMIFRPACLTGSTVASAT
jgi:ribosomal protein S27AE